MKRGMVLFLTLVVAMAVTTANAQQKQYVHTDTLKETGPINDIAFKDNETLISGTSMIGLWGWLHSWNVTTGRQRWEIAVPGTVEAVALTSQNRPLIAFSGTKNFEIRMRFSSKAGWHGEVWGHTSYIQSLAFKPNSYRLASGSSDNTIRIWDVEDRNNLQGTHVLRGHTGPINSVAWSPDGRTLASASDDGTVRLWNPNNTVNFAVLRGHTRFVRDVAWSPDGHILASGSADNTIRIWNPDMLNAQRVLRGHFWVKSLAFHPDGQTLASGGADDTIRLWNPNTGAHKATLKPPVESQQITSLAFSPNGKILACATGGLLNTPGMILLYRLLRVDVNWDGVVDLEDLLDVARNYGWVWEDPEAEDAAPDAGEILFEDVNEDGKVDIADLIVVAQAIDAAAAPALTQEVIETGDLQAADVRRWIRDAKAVDADPAGIAALERLLAALTRVETPPKKTVLLANYPNPFNPETWIPYQLSAAAEVTVTIHSSDGKLVRTLELGQMPAGAYSDKDRAAYWDGRNAAGEPVASGVYFYTLTAGDFSATRKMVIRK